MSVAWLISNLITNQLPEVLSTELASSRLRAGVCLEAFRRENVPLLRLNLEGEDGLPEVIFVGKYVPDSGAGIYYQDGGGRGPAWLAHLRRAKSCGVKIVVDYTDNHLISSDARGAFYREIFPLVSAAVVPSPKMAENLAKKWRGPIFVIPEPVEVPICAPSPCFEGANGLKSSRVTALWFGHNSNLPYLYQFIAKRAVQLPVMDFVILTNGLHQEDVKRAALAGHPEARYHIGKWSVKATIDAACRCDLALIPSDAADPRKNGVSSGRLLTALALGLPVAAEALEAYLPFRDYFIDIRSSELASLIANPGSGHAQVIEAQQKVLPHYTPEAVGRLWLDVLECVAG